jgi:phage baseplate assembly protein W
MSLTPTTSVVSPDIPTVLSENLPSKTYKIDFDKKRISGKIDSLDAVKQAIQLILESERYALENFSFDYGSEISNLIGKDRDYVESDIKRLISEALLADERIKEVTDFAVSWDSHDENCNVTFNVSTIFGDSDISQSFYV